MPPKRKIVSSGRSAKKRRVRATASTEPDVATTTSTTVSQGCAQQLSSSSQSLPIDYNLLAAAIIRQSQSLNCPDRMSPQVQTSTDSAQTTEQHHSSYAPSQPEVTQPVNPSGIGALLSKFSLGETAGSNQPAIDIKEGIPLGASVSSKLK